MLKKVQIQEGPFVVFNWGFRARIQMVLGLGQGKISICISLISVWNLIFSSTMDTATNCHSISSVCGLWRGSGHTKELVHATPNMLLWHIDYCELKVLEKELIQEGPSDLPLSLESRSALRWKTPSLWSAGKKHSYHQMVSWGWEKSFQTDLVKITHRLLVFPTYCNYFCIIATLCSTT